MIKRRYLSRIGIIAFVFVAAAVAIFMHYNQPHKDMANSKSNLSILATELFSNYIQNESEANRLYTGKVIVVTGKVASVNFFDTNIQVLLADEDQFFGVNCSFMLDKNEDIKNIKKGQTIQIKGECPGIIDDILLTRCLYIQ